MKRSTLFFVILVALFFITTLVLAYLNYFSSSKTPVITTVNPTIIPTQTMPSTSTSDSATDTVSLGTVKGNLCYPSEGIPPGNIIAKNISTGETLVQKYNGTAVDPSAQFSISLNPGTYHFKFEVGSGGSAGYYNQCAKTMESADCTPDENHQHLNVIVNSDKTTPGISICDFYYSNEQQTKLLSTF